ALEAPRRRRHRRRRQRRRCARRLAGARRPHAPDRPGARLCARDAGRRRAAARISALAAAMNVPTGHLLSLLIGLPVAGALFVALVPREAVRAQKLLALLASAAAL